MEFRHDAAHFNEIVIHGIVNQISSKEEEEGVESKNLAGLVQRGIGL